MKKYLVFLILLSSSLFAENHFIQKYNIELNIKANQSILNEITNLNKKVKNNKKCEINENINYTKNDKYPYEIKLNIFCNTKDNQDLENIKSIVNNITNSKNVKIEEYSTETYQASEETYKNEKDFLEKHKNFVNVLNKVLAIQQQMQKEMQKDFKEIQNLFGN